MMPALLLGSLAMRAAAASASAFSFSALGAGAGTEPVVSGSKRPGERAGATSLAGPLGSDFAVAAAAKSGALAGTVPG